MKQMAKKYFSCWPYISPCEVYSDVLLLFFNDLANDPKRTMLSEGGLSTHRPNTPLSVFTSFIVIAYLQVPSCMSCIESVAAVILS